MKIGVIGYGKMGKLIREVALTRGHTVTTIDPFAADADFKQITAESVADVSVCIDFTTPTVVIENIEKLISLKKGIVVGTTGWYDKVDYVKNLVDKNEVALMYASNFSLGVNIFYQIVRRAAALMNKVDNYDVCGIEYHHSQKADSPSGTAQTLSEIILSEMQRKEKVVFDIVDRKIEPKELHFASVRCGSFPGTHEISFDSSADTISLKHTARNRDGFAYGAVLAAEWISCSKGFFTIDDFITSIL
ncbi:MAG: 4-hydroxy-tetrahydrodipicolinate reductase [Bdellovibrionota bacterium]|jgi:4-hydroxy-tetrahydrodipicolinate reductase